MLPVDLTVDSSVRESFSRVVHGRGAAAIRNRWQQQIYSGRGVPPPERGSEREVVDFVEANPGAIGYLAASTPSNEVKVIELTD
jgi:ABC-type phosphate transport system substrate-binding protein